MLILLLALSVNGYAPPPPSRVGRPSSTRLQLDAGAGVDLVGQGLRPLIESALAADDVVRPIASALATDIAGAVGDVGDDARAAASAARDALAPLGALRAALSALSSNALLAALAGASLAVANGT